MKRFLSIISGLFNLGLILMFILGAVFYSGALSQNKEELEISKAAQYGIVVFLMIVPVVAFGLHLYGQYLWWSDQKRSKLLIVFCMFSSVFALALLFALVFLTLE